jgi:hypothetical protein
VQALGADVSSSSSPAGDRGGALHSMFDWQGTKDYSGFLSLSAALEEAPT